MDVARQTDYGAWACGKRNLLLSKNIMLNGPFYAVFPKQQAFGSKKRQKSHFSQSVIFQRVVVFAVGMAIFRVCHSGVLALRSQWNRVAISVEWQCNFNEMAVRSQWNRDAIRAFWRCDLSGIALRFQWNGSVISMKWRCDLNGIAVPFGRFGKTMGLFPVRHLDFASFRGQFSRFSISGKC